MNRCGSPAYNGEEQNDRATRLLRRSRIGPTVRGPEVAGMSRILAAAVAMAFVAAGCGGEGGGREVVAYTSVDQVFSEPVFREFEQQADLPVRPLFDTEETKSTGVLNRLIAEADNPRADVFWSGDPARPFLLIDRGLVEPYVSPNAAAIPAQFKAADGTWTGFAARARVLLVNTNRVSEPTCRHRSATSPTHAGGGKRPSPTRSSAPRPCM